MTAARVTRIVTTARVVAAAARSDAFFSVSTRTASRTGAVWSRSACESAGHSAAWLAGVAPGREPMRFWRIWLYVAVGVSRRSSPGSWRTAVCVRLASSSPVVTRTAACWLVAVLSWPTCAAWSTAPATGCSSACWASSSSRSTYVSRYCARPRSGVVSASVRGTSSASSMRFPYSELRCSWPRPERSMAWRTDCRSERSAIVSARASRTRGSSADVSSRSYARSRTSSALSVFSRCAIICASASSVAPRASRKAYVRSAAISVPATSCAASAATSALVWLASRAVEMACAEMIAAAAKRTRTGTARAARIFPRTLNLRSIRTCLHHPGPPGSAARSARGSGASRAPVPGRAY